MLAVLPRTDCDRQARGYIAVVMAAASRQTASAVPTVPTSPAPAPARLRHRRNARTLTAGQLAAFRQAITAAQTLKDDRGYQAWAGIHGLPLPISCTHNSPLFLPWHRAYLYFFEKSLQDRVPGVTLPWWNWTMRHDEGLPAAYTVARDATASPTRCAARRSSAPAASRAVRRRPAARPARTARRRCRRCRRSTPCSALTDFIDFQSQLEDVHGGVHVWVGGTMASIAHVGVRPDLLGASRDDRPHLAPVAAQAPGQRAARLAAQSRPRAISDDRARHARHGRPRLRLRA